MTTVTWSVDPTEAAQKLERRSHGETGALLMHACRAAASIHYLADHDAHVQADFPSRVYGEHDPRVVDIAHVRWASGAAITALDLCAATLAIAFCGWPHDDDTASIRSFTPNPRHDRRAAERVAALRSALPPSLLAWLDAVRADPRYDRVLSIRKPMTHARLARDLTAGRTEFIIEDGDDPTRPRQAVSVTVIVEEARDLATAHCERFITDVAAL